MYSRKSIYNILYVIIDSIPKYYGNLNPTGTIISFRTAWQEIFRRKKDKFELALDTMPKVKKNITKFKGYNNIMKTVVTLYITLIIITL